MGELEDAVILSQILFVVKDNLLYAAYQGRADPARTAAGRAVFGAAQTEAADITGSLICVGERKRLQERTDGGGGAAFQYTTS